MVLAASSAAVRTRRPRVTPRWSPPVPGDRPAEGGAGFLGGEVRSMSLAQRLGMVDRGHPSLSMTRQCTLPFERSPTVRRRRVEPGCLAARGSTSAQRYGHRRGNRKFSLSAVLEKAPISTRVELRKDQPIAGYRTGSGPLDMGLLDRKEGSIKAAGKD